VVAALPSVTVLSAVAPRSDIALKEADIVVLSVVPLASETVPVIVLVVEAEPAFATLK